MNLGSGTITIRSKKRHLLWTGQRAQHVAENYTQRGGLLHVEIQQAAQKAQTIKTDGKNQYIAYYESSDGTIVVPLEVKSDIAMVKSGHKYYTTAAKLTKNQSGIGKANVPQVLTEDMIPDWQKDEIVNYLGMTVERYIELFNIAKWEIAKKKKKKR
jgi:hypothetical protein